MAAPKNLPDFKGGNKLVLVLVFLVIVVIGTFYYFLKGPGAEPGEDSVYIDGQYVKMIRLDDIAGGDSNGKAVRYTQDGKFFHEVVADLPPLKEGAHYEGWLMQTPTNYVDTGKLTLLNEPIYTLSFVSDEDYEDYLQVVITLQSDDIAQPDLHILEGYFED